jgi:hypothetical protein
MAPRKPKGVYAGIKPPSLAGWNKGTGVDEMKPKKPPKSLPHPGFKAVAAGIAAKEGIPLKNAGAILAASSRGASAKAKKVNPRLNRVKGK